MDLPERTKQYYAELIRKGDALNYRDWLQQSLAAKQPVSLPIEVDSDAKQLLKGNDTRCKATIGQAGPQDIPPTQNRDLSTRSRRQAIKRELDDLSDAWDDVQESRRREAIYSYLTAVFKLIRTYRIRGKLNELICGAQQMLGGSSNQTREPYAAVMRATTEGRIDSKMISKYSRALRYASRNKKRRSIRSFILKMGGLNACAAAYAKRGRPS